MNAFLKSSDIATENFVVSSIRRSEIKSSLSAAGDPRRLLGSTATALRTAPSAQLDARQGVLGKLLVSRKRSQSLHSTCVLHIPNSILTRASQCRTLLEFTACIPTGTTSRASNGYSERRHRSLFKFSASEFCHGRGLRFCADTSAGAGGGSAHLLPAQRQKDCCFFCVVLPWPTGPWFLGHLVLDEIACRPGESAPRTPERIEHFSIQFTLP